MRSLRWIYQERESDVPWALYVEREWLYRKPRDAIYTMRLYSENIADSSYFVEVRRGYLTKEKALEWLRFELEEIYGEAAPEDMEQLGYELDYFF